METIKKNKNYWRPLWSGLILDEQAKHYRKMKNSVWLFLYLILKSGKTGFLRKTCKEISKETGVNDRTIRNWLKNLKNKGYVSTKKQTKGILIHINYPNGYKNQVSAHASDKFYSDNPVKFGHSEKNKAEKTLYLSDKNKKTDLRNTYDNDNKYINNDKRIINIFNNDINDMEKNKNRNGFNSFNLTREELLARELAEGLDDVESMRFYLAVTKKFPEELLIKIYREVKRIPSYKIKKSRGALFNYLLQKYEQDNSFD